jgi:hypothetical protein
MPEMKINPMIKQLSLVSITVMSLSIRSWFTWFLWHPRFRESFLPFPLLYLPLSFFFFFFDRSLVQVSIIPSFSSLQCFLTTSFINYLFYLFRGYHHWHANQRLELIRADQCWRKLTSVRKPDHSWRQLNHDKLKPTIPTNNLTTPKKSRPCQTGSSK